ncbi:MAG: GTP cyclohydrolase II [Woeseia sp.]|nr:GTP cyclohydrolase II [Woeseia sp.]MBT8096559.1 GTP cyclohydrolase II [Woeseia sp.]NNE61924.1 GTP cyclohydrolase II [Woeseia sp.]NNL56014.1 GTP cyclohydrolase II [Woeseia sp.]
MFTYIDPDVRKRLLRDGKLQRIDANGQRVTAEGDALPGTRSLSILGPIPLPLHLGGNDYRVDWYASVRHTELSQVQELADELREREGQASFAMLASSMAVNSVLLFGNPADWQDPLVRVHSSCLTGDVFGSQRCECGPQFVSAVDRIAKDPAGGMLIYMSGHEGRGIGLWAKAATYLLQDAGENTYQANRSLGLPDDSRDFSDAASLLKFFLGDTSFRLLTNNPKKLADLNEQGLRNITRVKHITGISAANRDYLAAKRDWGHALSDEDLDSR